MKLYYHPASTASRPVLLFAAENDIPLEMQLVDIFKGELFCLLTTLLDHEFAPAVELAAAYAQRWEIELSFDDIEIHHTGGDRVVAVSLSDG